MPSWTFITLGFLAILLTGLILQLGSLALTWLSSGKLAEWLWQQLSKRFQQWIILHLQKTLSQHSARHWLVLQFGKVVLIAVVFAAPLQLVIKLVAILLLLLPDLRAWQHRRLYRRQLLRQWPATLDVIAMTLHAGLSFRATLHTLSDSATASIAFHELARMNAQQQAGFSLDEVLNEFANRIPHPSIALFKAAVLHAQKGGGALASTLEQQAQQARTMQLLAAEKSAQEASVKLLLPLLTCFFPVTFLLILGPVILSFIQGDSM